MTSSRSVRVILALILGGILPGTGTLSLAQEPSPAPDVLKVGDILPAFDAEGLDGVPKRVDYPKGSTSVLLFFLSGCPHCHRMIPLWNSAFERKPGGIQVIGVLLDKEPPGFFMATPVSFPVLRAPRGDFSKQLKIRQVPMSVRVVAGGRVEDLVFGQVDPIRLGELFRPRP